MDCYRVQLSSDVIVKIFPWVGWLLVSEGVQAQSSYNHTGRKAKYHSEKRWEVEFGVHI